MDITYLTSVHLVETVQTLTQVGQTHVHHNIAVAWVLLQTMETLELVTTLVLGLHQDMIPTEVGVTVTTMVRDLLLHRWLVHKLLSLLENVGFVVVAGSYLTVTADRVLWLHIVVGAADKAVLAVAVSSKLHTSKGKKWLLIQVINKLTLRL